MFTNKKSESGSFDNELFIYKIDSLKFLHLESHKHNPVIIDSRNARNGGAIFKKNGATYRPSQCNIDGVYGQSLNVNKIKKLTLNNYSEEKIINIKPNFHKNLVAVHHLHQHENIFVIDAAFKSK